MTTKKIESIVAKNEQFIVDGETLSAATAVVLVMKNRQHAPFVQSLGRYYAYAQTTKDCGGTQDNVFEAALATNVEEGCAKQKERTLIEEEGKPYLAINCTDLDGKPYTAKTELPVKPIYARGYTVTPDEAQTT